MLHNSTTPAVNHGDGSMMFSIDLAGLEANIPGIMCKENYRLQGTATKSGVRQLEH